VPDRDLRRILFWVIAIRVGISTLLLGSAIFVQLTSPGTFPGDALFFLIGITYALNIVWLVTLNWSAQYRALVDVQLACDALIVSGFIAVTGGVTSYFAALYVLPIAAASTVQFRRGGMMVATLSALLYVGIALAQIFEVSPFGLEIFDQQAVLPPRRIVAYTASLNVFLFFSIAFLSGSLADRLQRAGARLERASSEIAGLQAFNQHVIDSLASGLATTDPQGLIITFNRAAEAITGHTAASVIGHRIDDVLELPPRLAKELRSGAAAGRGRRTEAPYRTGDGRQIELGFTATQLQTPSGTAGLLFAFQDVTDIKKLERDARLRQRLAAVGEMAAGIAHEIRNPLASMSGSIQILRQELPLTDDQAQLMDIVLRESERLNETIRSFLAYARPQRFSIARFDVRGVLNDAALLLRNSSELHDGHVIDVQVPETEVAFEADENQIRQIVWNLATNGLRAMRDGGRLTLGASTEAAGEDGSECVVLEVADEGVGIPAGELDVIFQPFRGSFSKGTGLGLAIVHRTVSDYGGEIQVSSTPGSGTTVRVRLPVRAAATTTSAS
jgi:two-component system sensor histidine kinase PilS (NtrC family)